ncbi:MAG: helix-turn-helix domain-containing protein [Prevotellaceae bacterium]|jgi:transcriptional regulator with XRE-family HTH domain|nr:helix-turn-helix domain-containing protein [Prevotellaceae bacterium]
MKTGNKIRALRIEHNFSPIQVADMLEISESTYRKYETGKNCPTVDMLNRIAQIYRKTIIDLLPDSCICHESKYNATLNGQNESVINYLSSRIIDIYRKQISDIKNQIRELKKEIEILRKYD